jgi:hypothetical protein
MPLLREGGMNVQLAFDLARAEDPIARLRALVVEDGMTESEAEAAVADAVAQLSRTTPPVAMKAQRCVCEHPAVFAAGLGSGTCALCGREPRRA